MGMVYQKVPTFITGGEEPVLHKLMFIKKGGKATHTLGDVTRDELDAELICVVNEDSENWIGNYAEGLGLYGIKFAKSDCRDASDKEVEAWIRDNESVKF